MSHFAAFNPFLSYLTVCTRARTFRNCVCIDDDKKEWECICVRVCEREKENRELDEPTRVRWARRLGYRWSVPRIIITCKKVGESRLSEPQPLEHRPRKSKRRRAPFIPVCFKQIRENLAHSSCTDDYGISMCFYMRLWFFYFIAIDARNESIGS